MTDAERAWRLPREAMWFFVVAPPVLALLFDPHCASTIDNVVRAWLALTLFTAATGVVVHLAFERVAAHTARVPTVARVLLHGLSTAAVVAAMTLLLHGAVRLVYPEVGDDTAGMIWRGVIVAFAYLSLARFVGHLQEQAVAERTRAHAEREAALEARLAALTAQMQPHFLFNSLNVCAGLVRDDPDVAEATLDRLSAFLRYAIESGERRLVSLDEELDAVSAYLAIQHERFGERLRHEVVGLAPGERAPMLPPMLLQPLVENALQHGLDPERGGRVRIACRCAEGKVVIAVEDSGRDAPSHGHRGTGTGQRNVRERLRLLFGDSARLACGPLPEGGYRSEVVLPAGAAP
jgi:hypothetical protein